MSKEILIMLDYDGGPIWNTFPDDLMTGIPQIDADEQLLALNCRISRKYMSYYEFDSHDEGCWFNEERQTTEREEMRDLLMQLIERLNALNDGSFTVVSSYGLEEQYGIVVGR